MKRMLTWGIFTVALIQSVWAWQPAGWIYLQWPWAYDSATGDWHWYSTSNEQWIHGFPPADGWQPFETSPLANGWAYVVWPYAFGQNGNAWYYVNETDIQWCVNMRSRQWSLFGKTRPVLSTEDLRSYWRDHSFLGFLKDGGRLPFPVRDVKIELLAKAAPDECFAGIPPLAPPLPPNPALTPPPCDTGGQPKVNQAYVWGLTETGGRLWFGTAANVHCLVLGGYLGITNPVQTGSFAAEFGHSFYAQVMGLPPTIGDWRPPRIFRCDPETGDLTARDTPAVLPAADLQRLRTTLGLRSAGAWPGSPASPQPLVFLAGPALATAGGLNFFAFDAQTETLVASATLPRYNNIRKWLWHGGVLYTAVGKTGGGGAVLRWQEDPARPGWPFAFEEIGQLDTPGVELAVHEQRLFVTTWPGRELSGTQDIASLWMSPRIPPAGLTDAHTSAWQRIWTARDYEPDPVTAATYGGGALASHNGHLYWGTMHVPGLALAAHRRIHGPLAGQDAQLSAALGTHRSIAILRGRNFGQTAPPAIELLYGAARLPVWSPADGGWVLMPNAMDGGAPRFGHSGFGNPFNNYTWTMQPFRDELYVGTMDFGYLIFDMLSLAMTPSEIQQLRLYFLSNNYNPDAFYGADLFRFPRADAAAQTVSRRGLGNPSTYGVRTMTATAHHLYLGMANPMNLLTSGIPGDPQGGWELMRLTKK